MSAEKLAELQYRWSELVQKNVELTTACTQLEEAIELNKKRKVVDGYWNQDAEGQDGAEWSGLAKGGGSHQENGNGDAMTDD
tara:strand:- start:454 stop:699 length:246 start_codon:yes stop_codon:yes gene_type:complete